MAGYERLFIIEELLGMGAFGKVYKVVPRRGQKRRYALKVIDFDFFQVTLDDVLTEFNVMKRLEHRNIITMYNCFQIMDPSGYWVDSFAIQMEYCPFGDLTKFLRNRRQLLRPRKLLQWMEDLSSAVEYIHDNNIIHRDLKPDNILLDRYSILRISDFGIAGIMSQYYATTAVGTPYFVAPEVFERGRYTQKADIYSLGKVFICMTTLRDIPGSLDSIPELYGNDVVDVIARCINPRARFRPKASSLLNLVLDLNVPSPNYYFH